MPEIYWYLFWVGLVLIITGLFVVGGIVSYRLQMEVLKILRSYAEKGVEPPAELADQLAKQVLTPRLDPSPGRQTRRALLRAFVGALFTACVAWALNQWFVEQEGPSWLVYASWAAFAFFGFTAFAFFVAAVTTRDE